MFRKMRRKQQALSLDENLSVLKRGSHGVLACLGDDDYPYAVPLNYVYENNNIYVHCAKEGHKIDAILNQSKVSFAVVDQDTIVSEEYTSYFRSVIAFGKASIVEGRQYHEAFTALVEKYCSGQKQEEKQAMIAGCKNALIMAIAIEHLSGKQAKELAVKNQAFVLNS